jgi:hypothetical protein
MRTTTLTFSNSTFCPHSVLMCFVWIWEQTAIISLYNINWMVFIIETEYVYCVVQTGSLYFRLISAFTTFIPEGRAGTAWEHSEYQISSIRPPLE